MGRSISLGLGILSIADIVRATTVGKTFERAAAPGVVALVRPFLSCSPEIGLYGAVPRRRAGAVPGTEPGSAQ
jgi:hypothetical protein